MYTATITAVSHPQASQIFNLLGGSSLLPAQGLPAPGTTVSPGNPAVILTLNGAVVQLAFPAVVTSPLTAVQAALAAAGSFSGATVTVSSSPVARSA